MRYRSILLGQRKQIRFASLILSMFALVGFHMLGCAGASGMKVIKLESAPAAKVRKVLIVTTEKTSISVNPTGGRVMARCLAESFRKKGIQAETGEFGQ